MKEIAIFGCGGFGREVKMLIEQINGIKPQYNLVGFYDDGVPMGTLINGIEVKGGIEDLNKINNEIHVVFAIGEPVLKKKLINKLSNNKICFPTLLHPNVLIGKDDVTIEEGSIICAGCIITVNIKIGKHVILNLGCTVGHDVTIGDHCSFMPGVNISGEVEINKCVYVGTGAKVINQITIGENSIIGAGAVVSKNLPSNCTAVGIPAKPIKFHN